MLTELCRAQDSETPCDQLHLGKMSFEQNYSFIAPGSFGTRTAPGYRITNHIDPSSFTNADLEKYIENQDAKTSYAIENGNDVPEYEDRYRVKVFIYCPPCACQVATALDICRYSNKKDFVEFCVRIDHRQKTSCSASISRIEGLISVLDYLKEREKNGLIYNYEASRLKAIDREWLEREIYDYTEEDCLAALSPADQLARIAELHRHNTKYSCAAIVLLGEADYCVPLMRAPPFPPFDPGRMHGETQIFRFEQRWNAQHFGFEKEYMGTYSPKKPLPSRQPPPIRSDTMQTLETAQRSSKRPRSSASGEEGR